MNDVEMMKNESKCQTKMYLKIGIRITEIMEIVNQIFIPSIMKFFNMQILWKKKLKIDFVI
jgi:hypothetical protein